MSTRMCCWCLFHSDVKVNPSCSIRSPVDGYLSCFHLLPITNIHSHVIVRTYVFLSLGYTARSSNDGPHGNPIFNFLMNCWTVSQVTAYFHQQRMRVLHILTALVIVFLIAAMLKGMKWYLTVLLVCISQMTNDVEHVFNTHFVWLLNLFIFLEGKFIKILCPFEKYGCLLLIHAKSSLYHLGYKSFISCMFRKSFLLFRVLTFHFLRVLFDAPKRLVNEAQSTYLSCCCCYLHLWFSHT